MYRRCAAQAAAAAAVPSSIPTPRSRPLLLRLCALAQPQPPQQSHPASTLARAAAGGVKAGGGSIQPTTTPKNMATPRRPPLPEAAAAARLSTHAATGQSASEFLDDPGLLRDQAYVNGKWVDAVGEATFAVEGKCVSACCVYAVFVGGLFGGGWGVEALGGPRGVWVSVGRFIYLLKLIYSIRADQP